MARVIIIGAGLTGLSTAYYLERNNFFDYAMYEQHEEIGGLCRSVRKDGFTFDYTGHFFHGTSPDTLSLLRTILGHDNCKQYARNSSIYSHGTYTAYPYQCNLFGLPKSVIIDCIEGFIARHNLQSTPTFKDWVMKYFGQGFGRHFFFPYQEKIFDFPVSALSSSWVASIPHTTITEILNGALEPRDVHAVGYNAHFIYPQQGGIDHLVRGIAQSLKNTIHIQHKVSSIDSRKKTVTFDSGETEPYEYLITTMPLNQLLLCVKQGLRNPYAGQASKLQCNTVININLGVALDIPLKYHWVYYPEQKFPYFRIGFPHNLCNMAPQGHISVSAEVAMLKKLGQSDIDATIQKTVQQAARLFKFSQDRISTQQTLVLDHAYVIYDTWRDKYLKTIQENLKKQLIFSIGRYGAWRYSSMQDDIIDGCTTACTIVSMINKDMPDYAVKQHKNVLKEI